MRPPLMVYQLGALRIFQGAFYYEYHGYESNFNVQPRAMQGSTNVLFPNNRFDPDPRSISITTELVNDHWGTGSEKVNYLLSMSGYEIDIISFAFCEDCPEHNCCPCSCSNYHNSCPGLVWFHTRGAIETVQSSPGEGQSYTVTINFYIKSMWKVLNPVLWKWGNSRQDPLVRNLSITTDGDVNSIDSAAYCDYFNNFPKWCHIENDCDHFFSKITFYDPMVMYITGIWDLMHGNSLICDLAFPCETGYGESWQAGHTKLSKVLINSRTGIYSAPPSSVYAFTGFRGQNNYNNGITISVQRALDDWQAETQVTTIDVNETASRIDAAGYGNLRRTDMIIVGDTFIKPGIIVRRDNVSTWFILTGVAPAVSYADEFAGMCSTGKNFISIQYDSPFQEEKHAQLHTFRRL